MSSTGIIIPILFAGGRGKRLWPISNSTNKTKPFLQLIPGQKSLIHETIARLPSCMRQRILITCSEAQFDRTQEACHRLGDKITYMVETCQLNTAMALALALLYIAEVLQKPDVVVCTFPSDLVIQESHSRFRDSFSRALEKIGSKQFISVSTSKKHHKGIFLTRCSTFLRLFEIVFPDMLNSCRRLMHQASESNNNNNNGGSKNIGKFIVDGSWLVQEHKAERFDVMKHVFMPKKRIERDGSIQISRFLLTNVTMQDVGQLRNLKKLLQPGREETCNLIVTQAVKSRTTSNDNGNGNGGSGSKGGRRRIFVQPVGVSTSTVMKPSDNKDKKKRHHHHHYRQEYKEHDIHKSNTGCFVWSDYLWTVDIGPGIHDCAIVCIEACILICQTPYRWNHANEAQNLPTNEERVKTRNCKRVELVNNRPDALVNIDGLEHITVTIDEWAIKLRLRH